MGLRAATASTIAMWESRTSVPRAATAASEDILKAPTSAALIRLPSVRMNGLPEALASAR
ncbi:hypothetical protein D3C72_2585860 [compost metagenome]